MSRSIGECFCLIGGLALVYMIISGSRLHSALRPHTLNFRLSSTPILHDARLRTLCPLPVCGITWCNTVSGPVSSATKVRKINGQFTCDIQNQKRGRRCTDGQQFLAVIAISSPDIRQSYSPPLGHSVSSLAPLHRTRSSTFAQNKHSPFYDCAIPIRRDEHIFPNKSSVILTSSSSKQTPSSPSLPTSPSSSTFPPLASSSRSPTLSSVLPLSQTPFPLYWQTQSQHKNPRSGAKNVPRTSSLLCSIAVPEYIPEQVFVRKWTLRQSITDPVWATKFAEYSNSNSLQNNSHSPYNRSSDQSMPNFMPAKKPHWSGLVHMLRFRNRMVRYLTSYFFTEHSSASSATGGDDLRDVIHEVTVRLLPTRVAVFELEHDSLIRQVRGSILGEPYKTGTTEGLWQLHLSMNGFGGHSLEIEVSDNSLQPTVIFLYKFTVSLSRLQPTAVKFTNGQVFVIRKPFFPWNKKCIGTCECVPETLKALVDQSFC